jgi:hypothetical protein
MNKLFESIIDFYDESHWFELILFTLFTLCGIVDLYLLFLCIFHLVIRGF